MGKSNEMFIREQEKQTDKEKEIQERKLEEQYREYLNKIKKEKKK